MSISDEAVEAAAKVMFDQSHFGGLTEWPDVRDEYCALMRPALEAAAPYMLAGAWDEGEQAGAMNHAAEEYPEVKDTTNPYRSQS